MNEIIKSNAVVAKEFRALAAKAEDVSYSIWQEALKIADEIEAGELSRYDIEEWRADLGSRLAEAKAE